MTTIKTRSNVGQRIAATIIDYIIILAFTVIFILLFGEPNKEGGKTVSGAPAVIPFVFWFCWLIIPEAIWAKTLGHQVTGLKIITIEGKKPAFWQALTRRFCDIIDISCFCGLIAFILVQNTRYHQRLGDILAKTLVVDRRYDPGETVFEFENQVQDQ